MKGRGRLIVNLVKETDKANVSLNWPSNHIQMQSENVSLKDDLHESIDQSKQKSVIESDKENVNLNWPSNNIQLQPENVTSKEDSHKSIDSSEQKTLPEPSNHDCVSNNSLPQITKKRMDYYISPMRSDDSDIVDDSDADPNYDFVSPATRQLLRPKVVPASCSSSSSTSSLERSSSESSSSSGTEDEEGTTARSSIQTCNAQPISVTDGIEKEKKGKKRVRNAKAWKSKITKLLRDSGKTYQSSSKSKKQVLEKHLRPPCGDKCRLKCNNHINESSRQQLFDAYWALGDLQKQREFIIRHSQEIKPKYRYSSTQNLRALNTSFFFELHGKKIRVCKQFFKSTLDLNDRVIKTALAKKTESGMIIGELRGKHGKQPKLTPEVKQSVMDFITSIPRVESHYLRAQTSREYICSEKSLADIYKDYKGSRESDGLPFASQSTFNRIFNTDFNIAFHIPKKDQCDLCESFKNSNDEDKDKIRNMYEEHLKEKTLAREEKEKDKNRTDGTIVAVYDLQAVMQLPKGQVSLFFYKSRINCMNFTVSDLHAKDVTCYFWDETEGKRGAVEIGSCILEFIQVLSDQIPDEDINLIFYSDNCCGQQKNKYLLTAYAYATMFMKVNSITHKFLIRGHSQNEGDNVHSVIEKQIKRYLKSGPIYTPQQYVTLIRSAKKTGKPYKVVEMTHDNFYDVKLLQESWGTNFSVDEDRCQVKWHDIKILRVEKEHPDVFFYKTSFADETFKRTYVLKRGASRSQRMSSELAKAYAEKIPLSAAKRNDIKSLIDKNAIPRQYYDSYYKNVLE